jgi:transposase
MESTINYIGVDISKLSFDVAIEKEGGYVHYKLANEPQGFSALKDLIDKPSKVVMEASGPYYLRLAVFLSEHGIAVSVVNPLIIRRFCQMRLMRAKTDKKDASMIASYGKAEHPADWTPEPGYVMELRQLKTAAELLDKSRTSMIRQQEAFGQLPVCSKEASAAVQKTIISIEKQILRLEQKMQQLIETYHGSMYERLQTIPGLGQKTALMLIVLTGGFTKFSNSGQLCAYVGTSPRIFESGTSVKGRSRIAKMGMSKVRAMLYMCSWSAKRYNDGCKQLYDRLVEKGKAKKLALLAVVNKLLKQAFAVATSKRNYEKNYSPNICF